MRSAAVMAGGVLMLLSAVAHSGVGWPALRIALQQARVADDVIGALAVGWHFGGVAMLAFGAIVLTEGARLRRGDRSGVIVVHLIAIGYLAFGLTAFFLRSDNPFFLLFVVIGLLAGVPVLGGWSR